MHYASQRSCLATVSIESFSIRLTKHPLILWKIIGMQYKGVISCHGVSETICSVLQ